MLLRTKGEFELFRPLCWQATARNARHNRRGELLLGIDFNRTPFCACIFQVQGDPLAALREYVLVEADTETICSTIWRDFPHRKIIACPNPTGRRLQTSSAMNLSDQAILRKAGFKVKSPRAPWSIRDKRSPGRLLMRDANGHHQQLDRSEGEAAIHQRNTGDTTDDRNRRIHGRRKSGSTLARPMTLQWFGSPPNCRHHEFR